MDTQSPIAKVTFVKFGIYTVFIIIMYLYIISYQYILIVTNQN